MRLNRLSADHQKSKEISKLSRHLVETGQLVLDQEIERIVSIVSLPIEADIKQSNWASKLQIEGITKSGKTIQQNFFVKQTTKELFNAEKIAVSQLAQSQTVIDLTINKPTQFFDAHLLIFSALAEGINFKWRLRKCYLNPLAFGLRADAIARVADYGKWLSAFHQDLSNADHPSLPLEDNTGTHTLIYTTHANILRQRSSSELIEEISRYLNSTLDSSSTAFVHGDFGPQNIIDTGDVFQVVDWEGFHLGHNIEDCIHFVINILTQARHTPFDFGFTRAVIESFLNAYTSKYRCFKYFSEITILLAISNIFKRQEWTGNRFPLHLHLFYLPMLRRLAESYYMLWKHEPASSQK